METIFSTLSLVTMCTYALLGLVFLVYMFYPAIVFDIPCIYYLKQAQRRQKRWFRENITIIDRFEEVVQERGDKTFIYFEDQEISYSEVNRQANRMMNYLLDAGGVGLKDPVCVLMINEPLFVSTLLAIFKCGAIASLLNTNIRGASLMHCIKVCRSKLLICSNNADLLKALTDIKSDLDEEGVKIFVATGAGDGPIPMGFKDLTRLSLTCSEGNDTSVREGIDVKKDSCLYLYTSGTTGLPKAIDYNLRRCVVGANMPYYVLASDDIFYICLPLYHAAALIFGLVNVIQSGASLALRKKFSVREFWNDVRRYRITVIQYIGETARYLVQAPRSELDGVYPHGPIRIAVGNGLTADIWQEFEERFNIEKIDEFYAASDGFYGAINIDGKVGTVGRYTPLIAKLYDSILIIECDMENAEPKRGLDGFCIQCPRGKGGLLVARVADISSVSGYVGNKQATERRLIRDVRQGGDCYFNTGDLMLIDEEGYIYFKDRLGSTFRWKGENVATTEVEMALLENSQVASANVYGVKIKGKDGRAGMAALILESGDRKFDGQSMYQHIMDRLPHYACPKFLRIKDSLEMTSTFKLRKANLVKEGFDPRPTTDHVYFMDDGKKTYTVLDENSYNGILSGVIRL